MRLQAALLGLAVLSGCATTAPDEVVLHEDLETAEFAPLDLSCDYHFSGIVDTRDHEHIQGYWRDGTMIQNLERYMNNHIRSWFSDHLDGQTATALEVELLRMYSSNMSTRGFFNVVIKVKLGRAEPEYLRGRYSSTIWLGGPSEFQVKAQRAVNAALTELYEHLEDHCVSESS